MKKATLIVGILMCTLLTGCGQVKVGYINGERITKEAPQIKATMDEGSKKMQEVQQDLVKKMEENPNMSQEESEKLQTEAQRKAMGYSQQYITQVQQKLNVALEEISKEKKIDVVLDNSAYQKSVFIGGEDLTDEAIKKLQ